MSRSSSGTRLGRAAAAMLLLLIVSAVLMNMLLMNADASVGYARGEVDGIDALESASGPSLHVALMEEHNEAIAEWLAAQRYGRLAPSFALVHFDSHPDMSMSPRNFHDIERVAASGDLVNLTRLLDD